MFLFCSAPSFDIYEWTLQVFNSSSTSLNISWSVNTSHPVSRYLIRLTNRDSVTSAVSIVDPDKKTTEVHGLFRYSNYCVKVTIISEHGLRKKTDAVCASTAIDS